MERRQKELTVCDLGVVVARPTPVGELGQIEMQSKGWVRIPQVAHPFSEGSAMKKDTIAFVVILLALLGVTILGYTAAFLVVCSAMIVCAPIISAVIGLRRPPPL